MTEIAEGRRRGRPKTGQKPIVSFRPPESLLEEFDQLVAADGSKRTDVLITLMHDWIKKKRSHPPKPPASAP